MSKSVVFAHASVVALFVSGLLFTFNLGGCVKRSVEPAEDKKLALLVGSRLEGIDYLTDRIGSVTTASPGFTLVVAFSIDDCPPCLAEYPLWQKIHEDFSEKIRVIGVVPRRQESQTMEWLAARRIVFPVNTDHRGGLFERYKLITPIKILLDSTNRVILCEPSTADLATQEKFLHTLSMLLTMQSKTVVHRSETLRGPRQQPKQHQHKEDHHKGKNAHP